MPEPAGSPTDALAFVAGATGYVGREVVRVLRERGVRTVAHVRPDSPRLAEWRDHFTAMGAEVDATPWEEDAMAAALARLSPSHVFALLGTTQKRDRAARRAGKPPESYDTVDYGLTALLLRAAKHAPRPPRFVYLSAAGVGPGSRSPYMKVRHRMETELGESGVPFTIARPSFITGPDRDERRPLERLGAGAVDAALAMAGAVGARRLRDRFRSTTNTDLAHALAAAAFDSGCVGATLEGEALRALSS
ncbi:MAG: NAD(P)H-binding protein [Myxococcota bacterium]